MMHAAMQHYVMKSNGSEYAIWYEMKCNIMECEETRCKPSKWIVTSCDAMWAMWCVVMWYDVI